MQPDNERQVVWHNATVTRTRRETQNGHRGVIVWFTGHSGAGKSTIAHTVEEHLHQAACRTLVFDGDNVRHGLCADLGFSMPDRSENIRRIGEMSKLFIEAGIIALTAFISPIRADRARVRALAAPEDFLEVYCHCPLEICESRDVKDIYPQDTQHDGRRRSQGRRTGMPSRNHRIRPGEKLHEIMITEDDALNTVEFDTCFAMQPAAYSWDKAKYLKDSGGKPVAENFRYSSDSNPQWMTREQLGEILKHESIEV